MCECDFCVWYWYCGIVVVGVDVFDLFVVVSIIEGDDDFGDFGSVYGCE